MTTFVITEESTHECNACCCKPVRGVPGEIDRWVLDLAPWAVPIGGKGISEIVANVELLHTPSDVGKTKANNGAFTTPFNTLLSGDLASLVTNPGTDPLAFSFVAFYGPHYGDLSIQSNGTFQYRPRNGYTGYDKFYYEVKTAAGARTIAQVVIGVEPETGSLPSAPDYDPLVAIPDSRISLNRQTYRADMAVIVSPAAVVGSVYRVTVKATALDCDCNPFTNLSCFDLTIGKC